MAAYGQSKFCAEAYCAIQGERPRNLVKQRYRRLRGMGRYSSYIGITVSREVSEISAAAGRRAAAIVSRLRRHADNPSTSKDEGLLIP